MFNYAVEAPMKRRRFAVQPTTLVFDLSNQPVSPAMLPPQVINSHRVVLACLKNTVTPGCVRVHDQTRRAGIEYFFKQWKERVSGYTEKGRSLGPRIYMALDVSTWRATS
jgi:hypothetical protein